MRISDWSSDVCSSDLASIPGRSSVDNVVHATGSLAARREMPIGVVGEGGRVMRVLVEPGDWVRAGQALATIERSVQTQQTRSLAAQVEVARKIGRGSCRERVCQSV